MGKKKKLGVLPSRWPDHTGEGRFMQRKLTEAGRRSGAKEVIDTNLTFSGCVSQTGQHYFLVSKAIESFQGIITSGVSVVPIKDYRELPARLQESGMSIPHTQLATAIMKEASRVRAFTPAIVIERPGFADGIFVLGNGEYVAADSKKANKSLPILPIAFGRSPGRALRAGSLKEWNAEADRLLRGQDIGLFAILVSLAATIKRFSHLDDNFGFQIIGPPASGKTTALFLAAAVWGAPKITGELVDADTLRYVGRDRVETSNDHPLILVGLDRAFALETPKQKLEFVRGYDLAFGHVMETELGIPDLPISLIALSASQRTVQELCGDEEAASARLSGRLITIPVPTDRTGKAVAVLPENIRSSSEMIEQLRQFAVSQYGHAGPELVRRLLLWEQKDSGEMRARFRRGLDAFVNRTAVDLDDGLATRHAYRFALLNLAGRYAQHIGVLPGSLKITKVVLKCYHLSCSLTPSRSFADRLLTLLRDANTVKLGKGKLPLLKKDQITTALAFIREKSDCVQIYVRPENIGKVFTDWISIKASSEVQALMEHETETRKDGSKHRRWKVQRKLGQGLGQVRVFCFVLPIPADMS